MSTEFDEDVPFDQFYSRREYLLNSWDRYVEIERVQSVINSLDVIGLCLEFLLNNTVVHAFEVRVGNPRATWRRILHELSLSHLFVLHRVMCIRIQHDKTVAQDMDLSCIVELVLMTFVVDLWKNIDDSLNLLCFSWQTKFRKEEPESLVEYKSTKIQKSTVLTEDFKYVWLVFAEVLAKHHLANVLMLDQVAGDCFWVVLDNSSCNRRLNCVFWIFSKGKSEFFGFSMLLGKLFDVVQLPVE